MTKFLTIFFIYFNLKGPTMDEETEKVPSSSSVAVVGEAAASCEMCANYEIQLQTIQAEQDSQREHLAAAKELCEKYGKELSEERHYRKDLEGKLAILNEETERKIQHCLGNLDNSEERLILLGKKQEADLTICFEDLELAKNRQKELQNQLIGLNERYQKLLRANSQCAEEMRDQQIELPQTVEELQFLALQLREDLITERAAREHETRELRDELTVAREQLLEMEIRDRENEELLSQVQQKQQQRRAAAAATAGNGRRERSSASTSNYECSSSLDKAAANVELAGDCCPNHRRLCTDLESQLTFAVNKSARLEQMLTESKQRCKQMQNELDTSEAVQKDFVRLSQQLQIELEKIRQSEVEIRWQEAEDVGQCNGCNKKFTDKDKISSKNGIFENRSNCKHCGGKIFCNSCLAHKLPSGQSKRLVPVCAHCYGLLSKEHSLVGELKTDDA